MLLIRFLLHFSFYKTQLSDVLVIIICCSACRCYCFSLLLWFCYYELICIPFIPSGLFFVFLYAVCSCDRFYRYVSYLLICLFSLIIMFLNFIRLSFNRPAFTTTLHDACATYLVELESICSRDRNVQDVLARFKALQSRLKRML